MRLTTIQIVWKLVVTVNLVLLPEECPESVISIRNDHQFKPRTYSRKSTLAVVPENLSLTSSSIGRSLPRRTDALTKAFLLTLATRTFPGA
jgi:hypothetical protein